MPTLLLVSTDEKASILAVGGENIRIMKKFREVTSPTPVGILFDAHYLWCVLICLKTLTSTDKKWGVNCWVSFNKWVVYISCYDLIQNEIWFWKVNYASCKFTTHFFYYFDIFILLGNNTLPKILKISFSLIVETEGVNFHTNFNLYWNKYKTQILQLVKLFY